MGFFDTSPSACFIDDLLNFNVDETISFTTNPKATLLLHSAPFTECEDEEELEWLSNEDAFPSVDTFVPFADIMSFESSTVTLKHEIPVSVLENSNISFGSINSNSNNSSAVITSCCSGRSLAPVRRPRSKGSRRRIRGGFVNIPGLQWFVLCSRIDGNKSRNFSVNASETVGVTGKKCKHCGSEKTPQWRGGPDGPKTLCNACGVRYKSGRLCPEYRPANSPTFSSVLHSSSHRKIVEMRK